MTIKLAMSIALLTGFSAAAKADGCATPIECISQALVALDETRAQLRAREEELTQAKDAIKALQDQASGFQGQLNGLAGLSSQIASVNATMATSDQLKAAVQNLTNGSTNFSQINFTGGGSIDGAGSKALYLRAGTGAYFVLPGDDHAAFYIPRVNGGYPVWETPRY